MKFKYLIGIFISVGMMACNTEDKNLLVDVFETSAAGNKLQKIETSESKSTDVLITIKPDEKYQTITGFGGSFTESSAYLLNQLSPKNRHLILDAYFGSDGAKYSLTRTHINSCDFH